MITKIEALGFRCLRYVSQPVSTFHVLVGANASGKTTFLDVVNFLGTLVGRGIDEAVEVWTSSFSDLVWGRSGRAFELAIEARIPEGLRTGLNGSPYRDIVRYEVRLAYNSSTDLVEFEHERVLLAANPKPAPVPVQRELFPESVEPPDTIFWPRSGKFRSAVKKVPHGNDNFYAEEKPAKGEGGWAPSFKLGPRVSALGSLPADPTRLAVSRWLRDLLTRGTQTFVLNSLLMRKASAPGQGRGFKTDGGNLPWVVDDLIQRAPDRFHDWIVHLRTALPDLASIRVVERPDDKHKYLMLKYDSGVEVPSWMASDGTLRLLALTLPACLPAASGVFLIEEPENGVHPRAVETLYQSLRSVYGAQVLLASHSPVILGLVEARDVLCFAKTPDGQTDIVPGDLHPALREWKRESDLGLLLAGGVLG
ncbi:AAA family ATPase [Candidatus Poribacteria bacterium]|nr:AAA family ATPase [Candidatus Poribacteria bacterium]